ncbi:hypothetical protein [Marinomonas sp. GJ51-6]|uniref:hypothetical protein n=1 Tax=Marinomonas sp. GJ51-6 TaxID=2992802 RepID=UPI00293528A1|nr:hypothetical protein [Marinomonas sp. GJ51-6]WOD06147.1 hypothetical protein ONZ50_10385 [Marinomonas sp. GJ51-6]
MDTMISTIRNLGLFIVAISLVACTSPPRDVDARLPLVESSKIVSSEIVPSKYWKILEDSSQKEFSHNHYLIHLSQPYDSALNTQCRLLSFFHDSTNKFMGTRTVCVGSDDSNDSVWFLTNNISSEETSVSLQQ